MLLAAAPVGFGFVDREFRVVRLNEKLAEFNGPSAEEQIGHTIAELVPSIWPEVEPFYRQVIDSGEAVVNLELSREVITEPGRVRHWLASYYPVRLDIEIIGVGIVLVDITGRKRADQAREELTRSAVAAIAATAEARDPYTAGHQRRVANIAAAIAVELGMADDEVNGIRLAASLHDIGKAGIPAEILVRPRKLSPIEWELVKGHSRAGYEIVADIDFPWPVAEMILQHHERMDGSGYPDGLRGEKIGIGGRIIAVADTVEAMVSHRPYRPALGLDAALQEISENRGKLFDVRVVDACLRLFREGRLALETGSPAYRGLP
jgi:PAS domain S-box-containing protein/putative nucleotidyltransferase with HDIG domain